MTSRLSKHRFNAILAVIEAITEPMSEERNVAYWAVFKTWTEHDFLTAVGRTVKDFLPTDAVPWPAPRYIIDRGPGHQAENVAIEIAWMRVQEEAVEGPGIQAIDRGGFFPTGTRLNEVETRAIGGTPGLRRLRMALEENDRIGLITIGNEFRRSVRAIMVAGLGATRLFSNGEEDHPPRCRGR